MDDTTRAYFKEIIGCLKDITQSLDLIGQRLVALERPTSLMVECASQSVMNIERELMQAIDNEEDRDILIKSIREQLSGAIANG